MEEKEEIEAFKLKQKEEEWTGMDQYLMEMDTYIFTNDTAKEKILNWIGNEFKVKKGDDNQRKIEARKATVARMTKNINQKRDEKIKKTKRQINKKEKEKKEGEEKKKKHNSK